jgi:threonine dehydrogenase-like Zn-dependent dehydrogenase
VIGCGPIGLIAARVITNYSPAALLGVDLAASQATMAARVGFSQFTESQDAKELKELSGSDGWDLVVNCALGAKPLGLAFQIVRPGGAVVVIGGAPDRQSLEIPANLFVTRDLHVEGLLGYTTQSWVRTLDLVATGRLRLGDLITHRLPLSEFGSALELVESRREPTGKVAIAFSEE